MKLAKSFEKLQEQIDHEKLRMDKEIKQKEYEFVKAVVVIDGKLKQAMVPVLEDMQTLMRDKVRTRNNDILLQKQMHQKMDDIMNINKEIRSTVEETLCPLVTCLFESSTIQMRSEEQDEIDRLGIALYGQKEQQTDLFRQSKIEKK